MYILYIYIYKRIQICPKPQALATEMFAHVPKDFRKMCAPEAAWLSMDKKGRLG